MRIALLPICLCFLLNGCTSTVAPVRIHDTQASWDQNEQTSGFLGFDADGNALITAHARDRYNALVSLYGAHFQPKLRKDDGIRTAPDHAYRMDAEHLVKFMTMNRWKKEGKP